MSLGQKTLEKFYEICSNRGADEERLVIFLKEYADGKWWLIEEDTVWNLAIHVPSIKRNHQKPVIIQAHLDMVQDSTIKTSEGNEGYDYSQGIIPEVSADRLWIHSKWKKTTLWADCGIGISMALESTEIEDRPPLIILLTRDEEGDMTGAAKIDPVKLKLLDADYMINADNNFSDQICIGSGGWLSMKMEWKYSTQQPTFPQYEIHFENLLGGHSGEDIDKGRINIIQEWFWFLKFLENEWLEGDEENVIRKKTGTYELVSFSSGKAENAIPGSCTIRLWISDENEFNRLLTQYLFVLKLKYPMEDTITYRVEQKKSMIPVMLRSQQSSIIKTLSPKLLGQISRDEQYNLPRLSNNVWVCQIWWKEIQFSFYGRADDQSLLQEIWSYLYDDFSQVGLELKKMNQIAPWKPIFDSVFLDIAKVVHAKVTWILPKIVKMHSSLECGILKTEIEKASKKALQIICVGPDIINEHSPNESLNIQSVDLCMTFILRFLEVIWDSEKENAERQKSQNILFA